MTRLASCCLFSWALLGPGLAFGQVPVYDPLQPAPFPVSVPNLPTFPAPVSVPVPPAVSIPTPVLIPQPTRNPIGNPIGNPIDNPIGNPIGNPIQTPLGDPIGNPIQTPDVTAVGDQGQQRPPGQGENQSSPSFRVYVGTYTNAQSQSEGIYSFTFNPNDGTLSDQSVAAKTDNPSFLAIHPSRRYLYAVNEVGQFEGKPTGSVTAFQVDPKSGGLTTLNVAPSGGGDPCYVTVDATGSDVLVANYSGGSIRVFPVGPDGKLGSASETIKYEVSDTGQGRRSNSHAHSIDLGPDNRFAVVADLGFDRLMVYHFDPKQGSLRPNIPGAVKLGPGAGPRHVAFHPDGRHVYVINETASTITLFDFDSSRGTFSALETVHTRPDPGKPNNSTAEIAVHPSGRFVYGSNRGDDTIAIFQVAPASGKLTPVGYQPTGGKAPRHFAIDPTGRFLLVGNQNSNTISIFRVDPQSGKLSPAGDPVPCPAPVRILFTSLGES